MLRALEDEGAGDWAARDGIGDGHAALPGGWRDRATVRTAEMSKDEVARRLQEAGVRAAPVYNGGDLATDPHMWARGFFVELSHRCVAHTTTPAFRTGSASANVGWRVLHPASVNTTGTC